MSLFAALIMRYYWLAQYSDTEYRGPLCDVNLLLSCRYLGYSVAALDGVPLAYFGVIAGLLVCAGALFPSAAFERTNKAIAALNLLAVAIQIALYPILTRTLCLLCIGYDVFAIANFLLFWKYGINRDEPSRIERYFRPDAAYIAGFLLLAGIGAFGVRTYGQSLHDAYNARVVERYFSLPMVNNPSIISRYWPIRATQQFEDAPIRIIAFSDLSCDDSLFVVQEFDKLKDEFKGKINFVFQFFPLDVCNDVVPKRKHPGGCEMAYIAAYNPAEFNRIHDEVFAHWDFALLTSPDWRRDFARRHGVSAALSDPAIKEYVQKIIETGAEYPPTSPAYKAGIRSTPTLIVNNRMLVGKFSSEQYRAIFRALLQSTDPNSPAFIERWPH